MALAVLTNAEEVVSFNLGGGAHVKVKGQIDSITVGENLSVSLTFKGQVVKEESMALKMPEGSKSVAKPGKTDYTKHLVAPPIEGLVSIEHKVAGQEWTGGEGESKIIHPGVFCKKNTGLLLTVEGGRTLNMGNYESARVTVTLTIPTDPEALNDAYEWGTNWISEKIDEGVAKAKGQ